MNTTVNTGAWQLILAHGLQLRRNQHGWRSAAVVLALVVLPSLASMAWGTPTQRLLVPLGLGVAVVVTAWCLLVGSLLLQNQPAAARLVPGHVGRLREVLLLAWALASVLVTAALMAGGLGLALAWPLAAGGLALLGLLVRWPLGWIPVSLLPFPWAWLLPAGTWAEGIALLQQHPLRVVALSALIVPMVLAGVLGDGGRAHRARHARAERWREMARSDGSWQASGKVGGLGGLMNLPYQRQLQKWSAARGPGTVAPRLMLGLGPAVHWTVQFSGAVLYGGILLLVGLCSLWIPVSFPDFLRAGSFGLTIGLMSALLAPLTSLGRALDRSRAEQGLLVLLPGVPRGRALNRLLARQWLLQFGLTWCGGLAVAVAVMAYSAAPRELLLPFLLAYLLPIATVWRDWSRQPRGGRGGTPVVLAVVLTAFFGYALYRWQGVPLWGIAAAQLALAAAVGGWGWRLQMSAPSALPVGRLA